MGEEMDFKALREDKGFTREQIADAIGASPIIVGMWENGESVPNTDMVITLCGLLDVCVENLMHSFPWWEKEHGTEWECHKNCSDCPNAWSLECIKKKKEKKPSGEGQAFNAKSAANVLSSIRCWVRNLNFDAGAFVRGWVTLDGKKVSEVIERADYTVELDEIIAYLESLC